MNPLADLPADRLLVDLSLWSADLARLADDLQRMEPWADLYHFDVSDAHFVPGLLFFPDLVAALRPLTRKPFHVHLMTENPLGLIDEFVDAGADIVSVHAENGPLVPAALERIGARGRGRGIVLGPDVPVEVVAPHLEVLDIVTLMGTPMGVKGRGLVPQAAARMRALAALVEAGGAPEQGQAGSGRRHPGKHGPAPARGGSGPGGHGLARLWQRRHGGDIPVGAVTPEGPLHRQGGHDMKALIAAAETVGAAGAGMAP